jgi:hypothetical protein
MSVPATASTQTLAGQQALEIARRLLDPADVLAATPGNASLGSGLAGTALLHARLSSLDPAFAAAATRHWTAAATHAQRHAGGIHTGPGALATSLIIAVPYLPDPDPHHNAITRATAWLSQRALDIATHHQQRADAGATGPPRPIYDAITGLAGIGRILLAALASGHPNAEPGLIAALTTLTSMINTPHSDTRPGWWLPTTNHPSTTHLPLSGAAGTGLAHGIAGPIALMSICEKAGWSVTGQTSAIQTAARWLLTWQISDTQTWPPYITGTELDSARPSPAPGRRDAWCHGTPGISRALTLAGQALDTPHLAEAGNSAMAAMARRPPQHWDTEGPTLCHGTSGVLHSTTNSDTPVADLAASATTAAYDPRHTFAFQHHHAGAPSDNPGLLTGAAGIALALADHGRLAAPTTPTRWDAILLLS